MERFSRVLQHGNPKIWISFQKSLKLNFYLFLKSWNHLSFVNISPTLVIDTWMERFSPSFVSWVVKNLILLKKKTLNRVFLLSCFVNNFYASPTSGEAYRDRQLTTNFEFWVEFFCVPTCFHKRIPKPCLSVRPSVRLSVCLSVHLSVPREKKPP